MRSQRPDYWSGIAPFVRRHWMILTIIASASFLRFVDLGSTPPGVWVDEFGISYDAWIVVTHRAVSTLILSPPLNLQYFIVNSVQGLFISQFIFGPSTFAIRFPSALMGVGLVAATFLLTKLLFNRRVALVAAILLAISPWAIQGSRVFYMGVSTDSLFFLTLGTYLSLAAIQDRRPVPIKLLIGSLLIGLSAGYYFTSYGRLTAILVFAILLWLSYLALRRAYPRLWIHGLVLAQLGIMGLVVLMVPILVAGSTLNSSANPAGLSFYTGTSNLLLQGHADAYWIFAGRYLNYFSPGYLFIHGDINRVQNTGMTGELLFPSLPFFYIGLAYLVYRTFRKGAIPRWVAFMLVAWLLSAPVEVAAFVPAFYTDSSGSIFMMPVVQIATAQGFVLAYDWVHGRIISPLVERTRTAGRKARLPQPTTQVHLRRKPRWAAPANQTTATCTVLVVLFAPALGVFVQAYWVENPTALLNDPNLNNWNFQWGDFYGFDALAAYMTGHGLTSLPVYVSPFGFFNNNSSDFNYFHSRFNYPEAYLYYYSNGIIDNFPGLANPPYFFSPNTSLVVSGSTADVVGFRSEGLQVTVLFNVLRPNGSIAVSLAEVSPSLNSSALRQALGYGAATRGILHSTTLSMPFLSTINQSFTFFMRFSIPRVAYQPNLFYYLFLVNANVPTTGWRISTQSYQPGGGSTDVMTLNSFVYSSYHNFSAPGAVSLNWYFNTLEPNTTYTAAIVFDAGWVSLYLNGTYDFQAYNGQSLSYPLQPMNSSVIFDEGVNATIAGFYAWNSSLTAAQIGYMNCYTSVTGC